MKVYDCFLFFNEIDLLKLRMNILNDVVDFFVIVESNKTFTYKDKKLFFDENKELFYEFKDKIIHVVIDDTPESFGVLKYINEPTTIDEKTKNLVLKYVDESTGWNHNLKEHRQWGVETYQRESIIKGLINCNDEDIVIISDLDEIPNPEEIKKMVETINDSDVFEFKQNMYYYYINLLKEENWSGSKACKWRKLKNIGLNSLRQNKYTTIQIENGGWHFSFFGGIEKIKEKLEAYSHQEFNKEYYINNIDSNINNNNDLFFRGRLQKVEIDISYPKYLLENLDKYKHMIKP